MKYLVAKFKVSPNKENACDLLIWSCGEAGFDSFEETDDGFNAYIQTSLFDEKKLNDKLGEVDLQGTHFSFTVEAMEDKDWNETWEESGFEPIEIENKCIVYDNKSVPHNIDKFALTISIDAKLAFGTGTHETTRMIVEWLLNNDVKRKNVADCGCGTGILSIAASRCGASNVFAYDIDEWSVRNTLHNAEINDVSNINVVEGDVRVMIDKECTFDIVMANINRNILLADMPLFAKSLKDEGNLILSGFYHSDAERIIDRGTDLGMRCIEVKTNNDWCLVVLRKS